MQREILKSVLIIINMIIVVTFFITNIMCLLLFQGNYKSLIIAETISIVLLNVITIIVCLRGNK